ncbi:hypothetical protein EDX86_04630, partial [Listeria monocytogenes]|nr:hypothetical protein [Listeria monocytogenes]
MEKKELIISAVSPERYTKFDNRSLKPIYLTDLGKSSGAVVEELDYVKSDNLKEKVEYIPPNNIGVQLAIVDDCIQKIKELQISEKFKNNREGRILKDKVYDNSKLIYDYITIVQQAIVFGYTSLETFTNLSIPTSYEYSVTNNKHVKEIYDKNAIERWISLSEKIS